MLGLLPDGGGGGSGGGGAASGGGGAAASTPPWQLLRTYRTRATPVIALGFTPRNLLLAAGPFSLRPPPGGG
jgi:hypothetical protein